MNYTLEHANTVLTPILDRLANDANPFVTAVVSAVREALHSSASGTMRKWMRAHNGRQVTTIQVSNENGVSWCPTGRTIDATKASSVQFSGSYREYARMHVIAATDQVLIVADEWHTIAYYLDD